MGCFLFKSKDVWALFLPFWAELIRPWQLVVEAGPQSNSELRVATLLVAAQQPHRAWLCHNKKKEEIRGEGGPSKVEKGKGGEEEEEDGKAFIRRSEGDCVSSLVALLASFCHLSLEQGSQILKG